MDENSVSSILEHTMIDQKSGVKKCTLTDTGRKSVIRKLRITDTATKHINNIFKFGELEEKSNVQKMHVPQ